MSLFLFKCQLAVQDPPESGKEETEEHTRDRENRPRCFVHSAELYACPVMHIPMASWKPQPGSSWPVHVNLDIDKPAKIHFRRRVAGSRNQTRLMRFMPKSNKYLHMK